MTRPKRAHRPWTLLPFVAAVLLIVPLTDAAEASTHDDAADDSLPRYQDFEDDAEGWPGRETEGPAGWCGSVEHRVAEEDGLQPPSGTGYAVVQHGPCNDFWHEFFPSGSAPGSTGFTYPLPFPAGGWVQQVEVYLDPTIDTGGDPLLQFSGSFWDRTVPEADNPRRYVIHDIPVDLVEEAGWYTFTHVFDSEDGALDIEFTVSNDGRTVLREEPTQTAYTGEDISSFDTADVGTGYVWFAAVADGLELPIDDHRVVSTAGMTRVAGADREGTAITVSQQFWPDGSDEVLLARADAFPDALAGGPLADQRDAPILLVAAGSETADSALKAEIDRLDPALVTILGGPAAVDPGVEQSVRAAGYTVERIGGADRYETAALIDAAIGADADDAVVASGERFPDALSAMNLLPTRTLLARPSTFTHHDAAYDYTLVGGPSVLGPKIEDLTGGTRLWGEDRYATAAAVLDAALDARTPGPLFIATGTTAFDALAAGPAVARTGGYLLLVDPRSGLTDEQAAVLADSSGRLTQLYTLGGPAALPDDVVARVVDATGADPTAGALGLP